MESRIISVDLAKDVFEVALANVQHRILKRLRLSRTKFAQLLMTQPAACVLFEACGTAHYWARRAQTAGHQVKILPAQYVRPYRRRNKTDRTDTEALLEAARCAGIKPVPVRSVDQQQIQQIHRLREQWKKTRTARINALRGCLLELGHPIPVGAQLAQRHALRLLDEAELPLPLVVLFRSLLEEIQLLETRIQDCEQQLKALSKQIPDVQQLQHIHGIGLLTSTALVACAGSPHHFPSGRHFSSWLGITPREYASGNARYLGRISKQGDKYLRMLIVHGARSVLARAKQVGKTGAPLSHLQRWALALEKRSGHNKATVALANKLARICWAVWKYQRPFNPDFAIA